MVGPRGAGDAESSGSSKSKARSTPVQLLDIGIVVAGSFLGLELWVLAHKTLFWIQCARKGTPCRYEGTSCSLSWETTKEEVNKGVQEDAVPNKAAGERMQQQPEQLSPQPQPTAHRAHPLPTAPAPAAQVQEQPGQLSPQPQPIAHSPHPQPTATVAEAAKWQAAQEKAAAEKEAKAVAARQLKERLAAERAAKQEAAREVAEQTGGILKAEGIPTPPGIKKSVSWARHLDAECERAIAAVSASVPGSVTGLVADAHRMLTEAGKPSSAPNSVGSPASASGFVRGTGGAETEILYSPNAASAKAALMLDRAAVDMSSVIVGGSGAKCLNSGAELNPGVARAPADEYKGKSWKGELEACDFPSRRLYDKAAIRISNFESLVYATAVHVHGWAGLGSHQLQLQPASGSAPSPALPGTALAASE
eukprot:gene4349-14467_t